MCNCSRLVYIACFYRVTLKICLLFWFILPRIFFFFWGGDTVTLCMGSWDSLLVRAPDSWSKSCEFESRQGWRDNSLLQSELCVLTLIRCPLHPSVTAVARKTPRLFCQKCRWQVTHKHADTLDPSTSEWADYAAVQAECWNLWGNELTRNSSGNTRLQSSQLAEPLSTDPGLKSGISLRELISALKKKKAQAGNESEKATAILPRASKNLL